MLLCVYITLAAERKAGSTQAWSGWHHGPHGEITVNTQTYTQHEKPPGPMREQWFPTQNEKEARVWANGKLNGQSVLIYGKEHHSSREAPHGDFAVFAVQQREATDSGEGPLGFERENTITLVPVRPSSVRRRIPRNADGDLEAAPVDLERADLEAVKGDDPDKDDVKGDEEEDVKSDEDEEQMMLQLNEGVGGVGQVVPPVVPFAMAWAPWAAYAAAGVAVNFAVGATLAGAGAASVSHSVSKTSTQDLETMLEVQVPTRTRPVRFQRAADLEAFMPAALATSVLFFPWGLAVGSVYYAATLGATAVRAVAGVAAEAAGDYVEGTAKQYAELGHTIAASAKEWAGTLWGPHAWYTTDHKAAFDTWQRWYWNWLWTLHLGTFWFLNWQARYYILLSWLDAKYQPLTAWAKPWLDWWAKVEAANKEYWAIYRKQAAEASAKAVQASVKIASALVPPVPLPSSWPSPWPEPVLASPMPVATGK